MAWGDKPIVKNDLDVYICNAPGIDVEKMKPLQKFAFASTNLTDIDTVKEYIKESGRTGAGLADVFYVIDHTAINAFGKLYLKLWTTLYYKKG